MSELPKVASNFFNACKKCGVERYHKVLTHVDAETAKLECEVCHSKKTFKIKEEKVATKRASKPRAKSEKKQSVSEVYQGLLQKYASKSSEPYRMSVEFSVDTKIEHPKFGVGFVVESFTDKVNVAFEDQSRVLVHNRK
jgi:hypothetical protein